MKGILLFLFLIISCGKGGGGGDEACKSLGSQWTRDTISLDFTGFQYNVAELYYINIYIDRYYDCFMDMTIVGQEGSGTLISTIRNDLTDPADVAMCEELYEDSFTYTKDCNTLMICDGDCNSYH